MTAHLDKLWVVIPAEPFATGKFRIAALTPAARTTLNCSFLDHVLTVAIAVVPGSRVIVVSRDEAALATARACGARGLAEVRDDLDAALAQGAALAGAAGARAVLSVFADLPQLAPDDLLAMAAAFAGDTMVIASDETRRGTNAMLMAPGRLSYGHAADSLTRHLAAAAAQGSPRRSAAGNDARCRHRRPASRTGRRPSTASAGPAAARHGLAMPLPPLLAAGVARLPTVVGPLAAHAFTEPRDGTEHLALVGGAPRDGALVRLHSECLTGDALGSLRCDCGEQLRLAQARIAQDGGVLVYLRGPEDAASA